MQMEVQVEESKKDIAPCNEQVFIQRYIPLVRRVVKQLTFQANSVMDRQDMEQVALMGLLEALRRYGREPDEQFAGYAVHRIRGAILDELRQLDWRPRRLRQKTHHLSDQIKMLARQLGYEPSFTEIQQQLMISADEYHEYLLLESAKTLESLDDIFMIEAQHDVFHSRELEEQFSIQTSLVKAIESLEQREKLVLYLYYEQELSLREIALVLDVTEARVCQMNKKIVEKIKLFLSV